MDTSAHFPFTFLERIRPNQRAFIFTDPTERPNNFCDIIRADLPMALSEQLACGGGRPVLASPDAQSIQVFQQLTRSDPHRGAYVRKISTFASKRRGSPRRTRHMASNGLSLSLYLKHGIAPRSSPNCEGRLTSFTATLASQSSTEHGAIPERIQDELFYKARP